MKKLSICTYALVRGYIKINDYKSLIKRNRLIKNNINIKKHKIEHILFHEGNIKNSHQTYIKQKLNLEVKFINLNKVLFNFKHKDKILHNNSKTTDDPLGYKYMCMFHSYLSFQYLKKYDFCLRIDDDLFLYSKLNDEFFDYIYKKNFKYIFYKKKIESHEITNKTLFNYLQKNNKINKLIINLYKKKKSLPDFCTNFTIYNPKIFFEKKVFKFLKKIYFSNNIIKYRWGDATLQALALILFSKKKSLLYLKNIKLLHGSQYYVVTANTQDMNTWKNNYNKLDFHKKFKNFSFEYLFYTFLYILIELIKKNKTILRFIRYMKAKLEK